MDDDVGPREPADLRLRSWRLEQEIKALKDTIAVLRAGADALAIENLQLRSELAELRGRRRFTSGGGKATLR